MNENAEREAFSRLITSAKILLQNAEGCAVNHYGEDYSTHGEPGWIADCRADIVRAADVMLASAALSPPPVWREAEALRDAERLAKAIHAKCYPDKTKWAPLSGNLLGLLSQIDNMVSGLSRAIPAHVGECPKTSDIPRNIRDEAAAFYREAVSDLNRSCDDGTVKPLAWTWRQMMHDSQGGWEVKTERNPPAQWVRPEDIRELEPLYRRSALVEPAPAPAGVNQDDPDEAYELGKRDGYEDAAQEIDRLTGGDGEYSFSSFQGEGCSTPDAMIQRIVDRFSALEEVEKLHLAHVMSPDLAPAGVNAEATEVRIKELEAALRFYADVSKYPAPFTGGMGALWTDCGEVARTALGLSEGHSAPAECTAIKLRITVLEAALERSRIALDDWLNTYAEDCCDPARVAQAHERIGEVGTLAYIADVQEQNRAALSALKQGEG
ncbi:hypothetical protein V5F77_05455 [Xanthobacter sp. DSM 24535]|uniref:hypothetical protein n=1 Tax=Roseixanthobacter psychrophilus TaxID=3119917 RepID=UPI0037285E5E